MTLKPHEIRELPPELKRCIQSFDHKEIQYTDRNGNEVKESIIRLKFIDKLKAIEMINKHIGFYEIDNKQKQNKVDLNSLKINELNVLYQIVNQNKIN